MTCEKMSGRMLDKARHHAPANWQRVETSRMEAAAGWRIYGGGNISRKNYPFSFALWVGNRDGRHQGNGVRMARAAI